MGPFGHGDAWQRIAKMVEAAVMEHGLWESEMNRKDAAEEHLNEGGRTLRPETILRCFPGESLRGREDDWAIE